MIDLYKVCCGYSCFNFLFDTNFVLAIFPSINDRKEKGQWHQAGLQVNRLNDRYRTWGIIRIKLKFFSLALNFLDSLTMQHYDV